MTVPNPDRTIHAERGDVQLVRYNRSGKWYEEGVDSAGAVYRRRISVDAAARLARSAHFTVHFGRPGGAVFDRKATAVKRDGGWPWQDEAGNRLNHAEVCAWRFGGACDCEETSRETQIPSSAETVARGGSQREACTDSAHDLCEWVCANSTAVGPELPEWLPVKTSDYRLRGLRDRHYAGGVGGRTVGQPGRRIAFVTFEGTAGWVSHWPDPQYVDHAFGDAFVCTLFRKECDGLASAMIEDAIRRTEARWGEPPSGGWLTFVDPAEVESPNPGYCFKRAGFVPVGFTKDRGLLVLRRGGS